jgi:PhnB protein
MTTKVIPYLLYSNCEAALEFLSRAFGFDEVLRYTGEAGYVNHAEMRLGDAQIFLGDPGDDYRNPRQLGGETVGLYVNVEGGVDELCERARAAGADIVEDPTDQEYGERRFTAKDPEGHLWFFGQVIREMAPEEWGATVPQGG